MFLVKPTSKWRFTSSAEFETVAGGIGIQLFVTDGYSSPKDCPSLFRRSNRLGILFGTQRGPSSVCCSSHFKKYKEYIGFVLLNGVFSWHPRLPNIVHNAPPASKNNRASSGPFVKKPQNVLFALDWANCEDYIVVEYAMEICPNLDTQYYP